MVQQVDKRKHRDKLRLASDEILTEKSNNFRFPLADKRKRGVTGTCKATLWPPFCELTGFLNLCGTGQYKHALIHDLCLVSAVPLRPAVFASFK